MGGSSRRAGLSLEPASPFQQRAQPRVQYEAWMRRCDMRRGVLRAAFSLAGLTSTLLAHGRWREHARARFGPVRPRPANGPLSSGGYR